jgi:ubiquinone/menaquinone biosynthesis C-methylase UbiE
MSKPPHSGEHHHNDHHADPDHHHEHPHDWDSHEYVSGWAEKQDRQESDRAEQFRLLAQAIPYDKTLAIKILDVGAGYGALTRFLLNYFPNSTAVCQDGSGEMIALGRERMADLTGRFDYVLGDFSRHGWSQLITGPFEAVVSSIAIHNVGSPNIIRGIYEDIFPLVKNGGCFLNYDLTFVPLEDQLKWLRQAGFQAVSVIWKDERQAVFGGFKK